jgi:hypothetical protein
MSQRYRKHYEVLELRPEHGLKQLRDSYKRAVRKWHPDRFQHDEPARNQAEERTKSINRAYAELSEYHDKHGDLPLRRLHDDATITPAATHDAPRHDRGNVPDPERARPVPHTRQTAPATSSRFSPTVAVGVLLIAAYFALRPPEFESTVPNPENSDISAVTPRGPESGRNVAPRATFAIGSSIGEVHAVQGIPTHMDQDVWHYGTARIRFSRGRVIDWDDPTGTTLRVRHDNLATAATSDTFSVGADKATVRRIQGEPIRDSGSVWEYGPSRVYFREDRVSGWHESPLHPLKATR